MNTASGAIDPDGESPSSSQMALGSTCDFVMPTDPMNEIYAPHSSELSPELPSQQPGDESRNANVAIDAAGLDAPAAAPSKPKKKRAPRPTFEDGSLTRVFKFPSKKYPKSSYYVTDTEIIIRIRKARKKWKLILPKKRVVSCRTNRWFTKPRWIEIELTYTQAVRQGLHEPTPQPLRQEAAEVSEAASLTVMPSAQEAEGVSAKTLASEPAAPAEAMSEAGIDVDVESDGEPELEDETVTGWVPDDDVDPSMSEEEEAAVDEEAPADDPIGEAVDLSSSATGTSMAETDEVAPRAMVEVQQSELVAADADTAWAHDEAEADADAVSTHGEAVIVATPQAAFEAPAEISLATIFDRPVALPVALPIATLPEVTPVEASETIEAPCAVAPPAIRADAPARLPAPIRVPPKRRFVEAQLLAATLAMVILSVSADWSQIADSTADSGSCSKASHISCAVIVTGSIETAPAPQGVEVESPAATDAQTLPENPPNSTSTSQVSAAAVTGDAGDDAAPDRPQIEEAPAELRHQDVAVAIKIEGDVGATAAPGSLLLPPVEEDRPVQPAVVPTEVQASLKPAGSADAALCPVRAAAIAKSAVVQFGFASANLPMQGVEPLEELARTLRQCAAIHVMIEGHTDSDGDYYRNQSLSVRRAEAVRQHLVNAGVGLSQLSITGFGQIRPLAPNDSATNKSRNRRIELVVQ